MPSISQSLNCWLHYHSCIMSLHDAEFSLSKLRLVRVECIQLMKRQHLFIIAFSVLSFAIWHVWQMKSIRCSNESVFYRIYSIDMSYIVDSTHKEI